MGFKKQYRSAHIDNTLFNGPISSQCRSILAGCAVEPC